MANPFRPPPYYIGDWQIEAATARRVLQGSIPETHLLPHSLSVLANRSLLLPTSSAVLDCGILNSLDIEITDIDDAEILAARIAKKVYTAVQVVEAFCKRASIAQQCVACLTELMYDAALDRARELDEYLMRTGKTMGMLHGVPVSLKV